MSSAPNLQFKPAITIRLDPQPFNEGAYIGFAGTLRNFEVEGRGSHKHTDGFEELKELQHTPRQTRIDPRMTSVKPTPSNPDEVYVMHLRDLGFDLISAAACYLTL